MKDYFLKLLATLALDMDTRDAARILFEAMKIHQDFFKSIEIEDLYQEVFNFKSHWELHGKIPDRFKTRSYND